MVKAVVKFEDTKYLDLINEAAKVENKDPRVFMAEASIEKAKSVLGEEKTVEIIGEDPVPEPETPEADKKPEGA